MNKRDVLKKYKHVLEQPVTLYENFNFSKKSLTEAKKDNILDQLDKEDYQLIKSIYPESKMIIVGHPGNKKVFYIDFDHSGMGGYYSTLTQVFPKPRQPWNDEGEEYDEFLGKMPDAGYPKSRKEGEQQELAYVYSKYDRVLVIPKKKWLEIAQGEVPLDIDDTEPEEDEFNPPVEFYYGVYEIDENNDELDHISDFDTEEEAIKFAKEQSFPTHVVFIPSIDPDDDPEIAEYMEYNAPYEAYETIWSSLDESFKKHKEKKPYVKTWDPDMQGYYDGRFYITELEPKQKPGRFTGIVDLSRDQDGHPIDEGKSFDFDKINKKLHGNIKLKNESLLKEDLSDSETISIKLVSPDDPKRVTRLFKSLLKDNIKFTPEIIKDNGDNTYILSFPKKQDWIDLIQGLFDESMLDVKVEETNSIVKNESLKESWDGVYSRPFLCKELGIDRAEAQAFSDYLYDNHADEGYQYMQEIADDYANIYDGKSALEYWYDEFINAN